MTEYDVERVAKEIQSFMLGRVGLQVCKNAARSILTDLNTRTALGDMREALEEAKFLCDRLDELDCCILDDEVGRQFYGHVSPSHARLKDAIAALGESDR